MRYTAQTISRTPATVSANVSQGIFAEIVTKDEWRCYSSQDLDLEPYLNRFMNVHARVPSMLSGENLALVPIEVFRFALGGTEIEGWLYLNGAVVVAKANEEVVFLFIDNELAIAEGYPEDYFEYRTDQER